MAEMAALIAEARRLLVRARESAAGPQPDLAACEALLARCAAMAPAAPPAPPPAAAPQEGGTAAGMDAVLAALPDMMFDIDAGGRYTGIFAGPRDTLLRDPAELTGLPVESVLPPEAARRIRRAFDMVMARGEAPDVHYALELADGPHVFSARGRRRPAPGSKGPAGAVFLVRDVTHLAPAAEPAAAADPTTALAALLDSDLRVDWISPAFARLTGLRPQDILGQSFCGLPGAGAPEAVTAEALALARAGGPPCAGRVVLPLGDGGRMAFDFDFLPLPPLSPAADGRPRGFLATGAPVTDLARREAALAEMTRARRTTQLQLANALDALPDCMLLFDAGDRLVICNRAGLQAFPELRAVTVPGAPLADFAAAAADIGLLPRPAGPDAADPAAALALLRQPRHAADGRTADGRWFRQVSQRTADGGVIIALIDITARQRQMLDLDEANRRLVEALAARDRADERLGSIMEATQVGTWELEFPSGRMEASPRWAQMVGIETEGPIHIGHADFIAMVHPDEHEMMEAEAPLDAVSSPDMFEHAFRIRHRDGRWIWMLSRGRVVERGPDGEALRVVGVDLDISNQKRLEEEARASGALLASAMESSVAAIAVYDGADRLLYCNAEARRLLGLKTGTDFGRDPAGPQWWLETMEGARITVDDGPCARARRAARMVRDIQFAVCWPDGRRRAMICNASPVSGAAGGSNTVVSFWDITDQMTATENLEAALLRAEEMSRTKSTFLANMSHEIRTPLNGVLGLAEVLAGQIRDPAQLRLVSTIRKSGETLLSVLNSVLDMSKIEAGKMEIESAPLSLRPILQQLDAVYSIQAEERGLEFEIETSPGYDAPRLGDALRIQQVLGNLLNNAMKFTAEGGVTLTVSCRPDQPVVFEVRDTGPGMDEAQVARAFRSFEQADGSTTRRFGGTGLGLSIVEQLVRLMGGEVTLASRPGVGTLLRVSLPLPLLEAAPAG